MAYSGTIRIESFNKFLKDLEKISGKENGFMAEPLLYLIRDAFKYETVTLSKYGNEGFLNITGIGRSFENARETYLSAFQKKDAYARSVRKAYDNNPELLILSSSTMFSNPENEYHKWIRNYGAWWTLSMPIGEYTLSVYKCEGEPDFSPHEREGLKLLSTILRSKYNLQREIDSQNISYNVQASLLDLLGIGSICLNSKMRVKNYNKVAADFIRYISGTSDIQSGCEWILNHLLGVRTNHMLVESDLYMEYKYHSIFLKVIEGKEERRRHYSLTIRPLDDMPFDTINEDAAFRFGLTEREVDVARAIVSGKSYQEVADTLYISINTVRTHIKNIYKKMGISNQRMLAQLIQDM